MRLKEYPIGDYVGKCQTWNPKSSGVGGFDYIDLSSVDKDTKSIASIERYECSDAPSRARQLVETDDVLVATVRPNLNGVALVNGAHHGMTASTGYCVLRPDRDKLDSRFLFHWVKTGVFVQRMVDVATGANYPAVSDAKVKASKIPLPPLAEQKADCGDSGCGGRLAGQAPRGPRPARHPPPIHLPRHVRRPRHQSDGVGAKRGWDDVVHGPTELDGSTEIPRTWPPMGKWRSPDLRRQWNRGGYMVTPSSLRMRRIDLGAKRTVVAARGLHSNETTISGTCLGYHNAELSTVHVRSFSQPF